MIIIYDNPEDKENINLLKEFVKNKKIKVLINNKNLGAAYLGIKVLEKQKVNLSPFWIVMTCGKKISFEFNTTS